MDRDLTEFLKTVSKPEGEWDLFEIGLHLGRITGTRVDFGSCRRQRDAICASVMKETKPEASGYDAIEALNHVFFEEYGFEGNTEDYYDPRNSFLHTVLETRKGIPISLCIIYRSVAGCCNLQLDCVGMPGHFLLRYPEAIQPLYVDVFHRGQLLLEEDCRALFERLFPQQSKFDPSSLRPSSNRQVCLRMLMNLKQIYRSRGQSDLLLQVLKRRIPLLEDPLPEILERGLTYLDLQNFSQAVRDLEKFVDETEDHHMRELVRTQLGRVRTLLH